RIAVEDLETEFLIKTLRRLKVLDGQADGKRTELHGVLLGCAGQGSRQSYRVMVAVATLVQKGNESGAALSRRRPSSSHRRGRDGRCASAPPGPAPPFPGRGPFGSGPPARRGGKPAPRLAR